MNATRLFASTLLVSLAALPARAQYLSPVAMRASDVPASLSRTTSRANPSVAASRDTFPALPESHPVRTIVGGIAGGVAGTFLGLGIGAGMAKGCHGELCEIGPALLGIAIGESVGLSLGAHLGSGSTRHEHILLTSLTSAGILVAGAFMGAGMGQGGAIMVPLTPALQLAVALAIEGR